MSVIGEHLRSAWRPVVALALAVGLAIPTWSADGATAQNSLPETAAAAPETTVFFHQLDLDLEGPQWQQTEELLARVGLPDALDLWRDEILSGSADSGQFAEADLDALLGGEMAVIVTSDAVEHFMAMHMRHMKKHMQGEDEAEASGATPEATGDGQAFGVAAVFVPGDADAAWDYAQRQVDALAAQEDVQVEQAEYGDVEIIAVERAGRMKDGDAMAGDPFEEMFGRHGRGGFAAARDGDFIIAAPTQADIIGIVDVINGDAPSLAESTTAQEVVAQLPADALSLTYIDAQAIVESFGPDLIASLESFMPNMPKEAWGGAVGLTISATGPGFRLDSFAKLPEGADLDALMVANDPAVVASAERVPEGTFFYEAGIVPPNAFAGLPFSFSQMVNAATGDSQWTGDQKMMALPSPEEIEAEIAKATETLGFNPATDLFNLLGTDFIAFASFPSFSMEGFSMDAVAAVSTTDPVALAKTTRKIAAWIGKAAPEAELTERSEGGDTLYVLSDPEMAEAPSVEFGVIGDQAVVAVGGGVDDLLNEPSASLADDGQYQTVMAELPADFYQVFYLDIGQAIAPIMMLSGQFDSSQSADAAAATPVSAQGSLENIRALGMVAFQQDDGAGSSAILYIAEPGS